MRANIISQLVHIFYRRIIFLETVAGVPGMVAAMTRHLHSLRKMRRDYGWIHTLLGEIKEFSPLIPQITHYLSVHNLCVKLIMT